MHKVKAFVLASVVLLEFGSIYIVRKVTENKGNKFSYILPGFLYNIYF